MNQVLEIIFSLSITIFFATTLFGGAKWIITTINRNEAFTETYNLLQKGINHNTLDEEEILLIYNHKYRKYNNHASYADFLEEILIFCREKDTDGSLTKQFDSLLKPILDKVKKEQPYFGVAEEEKSALVAIEDAASVNNIDSVKRNLENLSKMIIRNQKNLSKSKKHTLISYAFSAASLALSGIMWIQGTTLKETDIDKIAKKTSDICISLNSSSSSESSEPANVEQKASSSEEK